MEFKSEYTEAEWQIINEEFKRIKGEYDMSSFLFNIHSHCQLEWYNKYYCV